MTGDRPKREAGDGGRLGPSPTGTSATRFRALSLLAGLVMFALLAWLLLQA